MLTEHSQTNRNASKFIFTWFFLQVLECCLTYSFWVKPKYEDFFIVQFIFPNCTQEFATALAPFIIVFPPSMVLLMVQWELIKYCKAEMFMWLYIQMNADPFCVMPYMYTTVRVHIDKTPYIKKCHTIISSLLFVSTHEWINNAARVDCKMQMNRSQQQMENRLHFQNQFDLIWMPSFQASIKQLTTKPSFLKIDNKKNHTVEAVINTIQASGINI